MTIGQFARNAVLAAIVASATACEDAIGPGGVAGTYQLVEAQGEALPAVVFDGETEFGHLTATAVSGSITLRSTTYTERIVFDLVLDGMPFGEDPVVVSGDYTVDGQLLEFDPDPAASPPFTGTWAAGVLTTVETDPELGELTLVWMR